MFKNNDSLYRLICSSQNEPLPTTKEETTGDGTYITSPSNQHHQTVNCLNNLLGENRPEEVGNLPKHEDQEENFTTYRMLTWLLLFFSISKVLHFSQMLAWLLTLLFNQVLHFSRGRGARPSSPAAIMCFAVFYSMLPHCDAAGNRPPNAAMIELNVLVLLFVVLPWICWMLWLLIVYRREFVSHLGQPEVPALPDAAIQPPINWQATKNPNANSSSLSDISYHHDDGACNSPVDAYTKPVDGAEANPRPYPHTIRARRPENEDIDSMVLGDDCMNSDMKNRCSSDDMSVSSTTSDMSVGSVVIGTGIAYEDSYLISFNSHVESDMSIDPSSSASSSCPSSADMKGENADSDDNNMDVD